MMRGAIGGTLILILLAGCASTGGQHYDVTGQPKDPAEVNTQLGIAYMRKGMYDTALEKLNKAIRQDPDFQLAQVSIAILYERLGEDDLAEKHYKRAYGLNRKDPVTLNAYGQFLCRKGKLERADEMFRTAVKDPLYQMPELVYTNAGICARKRPDMALAEKYFRDALKKNPKYVPALEEMARTSFARKQYLVTRAYLQRLQGIKPLTAEFLWIGVRTEAALGDKDAMSSYALSLKNLFPETEETQELIKWERKTGEH
jgi:type IV pilus assembly protein PilF